MSGDGEKSVFAFGGFLLDVRTRSLIGPDGAPIDISSRAFETLYVLASHPHELVDKHRLMAAVWPNRIVEENNLNQQISTLRKLLGEVPSDHRFIVTVTGQGYRFVKDVERLRSLPVSDMEAPDAAPASAPRTDVRTLEENRRRTSGRWRSPTIAAASAAALALGVTAAWLSWRDARPVVEPRLGAELVLPAVGGTRNIEAYDAYLAARAETNRGGTSLAREAIPMLERAVELDPGFALAWAALAEAYTYAADFPASSALPLTPAEIQQRISRAALRAFELAPDAPQTLRSAGMVSMQNRDWPEAERRLRKAAEIAGPFDYDTNHLYALFLMNVGRPTEARAYVERALRAEPLLLRPVTFMAALHEMRGELDEAEALLDASSNLAGDETMLRNALVMVQLGRRDAAGLRRVMQEYGLGTELVDDPPGAMQDLRRYFADAVRDETTARLLPLAAFSSFLGEQELALDMLLALGPTQNLHALWRPALREVRRQPGFEDVVQRLGLVDYWRLSGNWAEFCQGTPSGGFACE
jgi:DNA-binding winged helix-turn-helix (wHTH) protein/tetratricopeptide (TPR) repeat protein